MKKIGTILLLLLGGVHILWAQNNCIIDVCNEDDCGDAFVSYAPFGQNVFCEGGVVVLENTSSTTDFEEFYIDWGDGTVDTVRDYNNVTHVYNFDGIDRCAEGPKFNQFFCYVGAKSCANGISCSWAQTLVSVNLKPVAAFSVDAQSCITDPVDFRNNSCNEETYLWDFGDGTTSTEEEPNHQYSSPGIYNVTLTVTNECGDSQTSMPVQIIGLPEASVDVTADPLTGCIPLNVDFDNNSVNIDSFNIDAFEWEIDGPNGGWAFSDTIYSEQSWNNNINFTIPGTYTVTLTVENICGEEEWEQTIEVFQAPSVSLQPPGTFCEEADLDFCDYVNFNGSITDYTWVVTLPNGTTQTYSEECPSDIFTQGGQYTMSISVGSVSCGDFSAMQDFFVTLPGAPDFTNIPDRVCTSDTIFQLQVIPPGGNWSGSNAVSTNGFFNPALASPGIHDLTYDPLGTCVQSGTVSITVLESAAVDLEEVAPECDDITFTPQAQIDGEVDNNSIIWTSITDGGPTETFQQVSPPQLSFSTAGIHQVILSVDGACGPASDTIFVEVQSLEAIQITPLPTPLCSTSDPITLQATPAGGIWTGNGVSNDSIFDPSAVATATPVTLTYIFGQGVCEQMESITVEVIPSEAVDIEPDLTICEDQSTYTLSFSPSGGDWTGTGIIDASNGVFDPMQAGVGAHDLTYTYVDVNGCTIIKSNRITVEALPTMNFEPLLSFCETNDDLNLSDFLNLDLQPNTGTLRWSGPGIINASDGTFNSFQAGANGMGTYTILLEYTLVDCQIRDSFQVEITPLQPADAGADDTLCISDGTFQLVGSPAGGSWSGPGIDPITGEVDFSQSGAGFRTYVYTIGAGTSCEDTDEVRLEIIDLTSVSAGNDFPICAESPAITLSGFSPAGGIWTGPGIIDSVTGVFDPDGLDADSAYVLTYCLSDPNIDCTACSERRVRVNALPEAAFQITGTTCVGVEVMIENNSSDNSCDFRWDFGDGSLESTIPEPTHIYNMVGTYTIRLIATTCPDCSDTSFVQVTVEEPPMAQFAKDTDEGCADLSVNFNNQSLGTNVNYLWDFGNGQNSTEQNPGTIIFEQGTQDTVYYITLAVTNGCGTRFYRDSVTVFPLPQVNFGTNVDEGCSPLELEFSNITLGNPETYEWYIDGMLVGQDSIFPDRAFTTSDTAITVYTITLISFNNCGVDTLSREVTVFPPDVDAFLSVDTTRGCQPLTVQFSNFSTPGARINWDFGDGNGSSETNPTHTYDTAGIFTVYQYAENCGVDSDSIVIEVLPAPEVSFEHNTFVCAGQSITFDNLSEGIRGTFWEFGDGDTSSLFSPVHVFATPGFYTVTLTGLSAENNCPASFSSVVEVIGNPQVGIAPSATEGCAPFTVTFGNTSVGASFYEWDFGNGDVSNEVNPVYTYTTPGIYEVRLTARDTLECFTESGTVMIRVRENPIAGFTTDQQAYCSRVDSIYTTNTSQGAVQYFWSIDNQTSEATAPTWIIGRPGNFELNLIAENQFGCRDTIQQSIELLETPLAILNPLAAYEGCTPLRLSFDNFSEFSNLFSWDFGDGNSSSEQAPEHTFLTDGSYQVRLIAGNTNGCPADTATVTVNAWPLPIGQFRLDSNIVCGFADTLSTFNESIGGTDYFWNLGNGDSAFVFTPSLIYGDTGSYTITLAVQNEFGCRDTVDQELEILSSPIAAITPDNTVGCEPLMVNFINASQYSDRLIWDFGNGNTNASQDTIDVWYLQDSLYTVRLIAAHSNDCPNDTIEQAIRVHPTPISGFDLSNQLICGLPDTIVVVNTTIGANDYRWDFGNGTTSLEQTPTIIYTTPNEYQVSLIAANEFACSDTMIQQISVNHQPVADFDLSSQEGCEFDTLFFNDLSEFAESWFWDFGDGTISEDPDPVKVYEQAGSYTVSLRVGFNDLCFDDTTLVNAITIKPSPKAGFTFLDLGEGFVQFTDASVDANTFSWDFGDGQGSDLASPLHEYKNNGDWTVVQTVTHLNGCTDQAIEVISPERFSGLYFPNAMSPEVGLGDERLFKPVGVGIVSLYVQIFSPWGERLWEDRTLDGEAPGMSWDGRHNGKLVPQGAYVWKADVEYITGFKQTLTGTVTVLR